MDLLALADFHSSRLARHPLLVELPGRYVLSRNKLNRVVGAQHPRQTQCHNLELRVKQRSVLLRVVRDESVYGQTEVYEPTPTDGVERTPAHADFGMSHCEPGLGKYVSPDAHDA